MAAQITQTLTTPTTAPSRSQDPTTFNTNVDNRLAWDATNVTEMTTWQGQANTLSTEVNANAVAAESSANDAATSETNAAASEAAAAASAAFKGLWSSLSGALNMPASVIHNNVIWLLNTNSSNVAADVPGVSSKWSLLRPTNINLAREMGGTAYQNISGFPLSPSFEIKTYDYINEVNGFHPQATVARASTATYPDERGVLRTAVADVLRHWWNPATGEYLGVIIEEAATNLVTYSADLTNAAWVKVGVTISANSAAAVDGTTNADKLVEDSSTGNHYTQFLAAVSSGTHVCSVFASAGEYDFFTFTIVHSGESVSTSRIGFDLDAGPNATTNGLIIDAGMEDWGNGIKRCWVKYTLTGAATNNVFRLELTQSLGGSVSYTGDGTSGLYFWGMQMEKLAEMTSYIPTSGATATRATDSVKFSSTDFSDWFNATEGTFAVSSSKSNLPPANSRIIDMGVGTSDVNRLSFLYRSLGGYTGTQVVVGSVLQIDAFNTVNTPIVAGEKFTITMSYKTLDLAAAGKGANLTQNTTGSIPSTHDTLALGGARSGAQMINGFITYLAYFPRQINDSLLQVLSS